MKSEVRKVKKIIVAICVLFTSCLIFAKTVPELLDEAKSDYASKNYKAMVQKLDAVKKFVEERYISAPAANPVANTAANNEYIEVKSWDVIDLKSDFYAGKKVKLYIYYSGASGKDKINVGIRGCTFEPQLIDKILELEKYKDYTFYGTVVIDKYQNYIHVEKIE